MCVVGTRMEGNRTVLCGKCRIQARKLGMIRTWTTYVEDEIAIIGHWRNAADSEDHEDQSEVLRCWNGIFGERTPRHGFRTETETILNEMAQRFPSVSVQPIQDVYAAICIWHHDRSARHTLPQSVLEVQTDLALNAVLQLFKHIAAERPDEPLRPLPDEQHRAFHAVAKASREQRTGITGPQIIAEIGYAGQPSTFYKNIAGPLVSKRLIENMGAGYRWTKRGELYAQQFPVSEPDAALVRR